MHIWCFLEAPTSTRSDTTCISVMSMDDFGRHLIKKKKNQHVGCNAFETNPTLKMILSAFQKLGFLYARIDDCPVLNDNLYLCTVVTRFGRQMSFGQVKIQLGSQMETRSLIGFIISLPNLSQNPSSAATSGVGTIPTTADAISPTSFSPSMLSVIS